MKPAFKDKLHRNMGYFIVLLDIAIYLIMSYVFVDKFNVDILAIVVNGGLLFIGAMIANSAMMRQGILTGHENTDVKETVKSHLQYRNKIYPKIKYFQSWLDNDYYKLMKIGRTVYVNSAGYDYDQVFTETGKVKNEFKVEKPKPAVYTKWFQKPIVWILKIHRFLWSDEWKVYRQKKRFVRAAKRYKITRLTVTDLLNINNTEDPNDIKVNENKYMLKQDAKAFASRLIISILLQSVSFAFYGFNMATFLTQMLSIVLILLTSMFSMFTSYAFVVKTYRNSIIMKINKMEEFYNAEIKEEKPNVRTEESVPAESRLVENIPGDSNDRQENNICGDTNSGL